MHKCPKFGEDILKRYRLQFGGVGVFFGIFESPRWSPLRMSKKWCHFSWFITSFEHKNKKLRKNGEISLKGLEKYRNQFVMFVEVLVKVKKNKKRKKKT